MTDGCICQPQSLLKEDAGPTGLLIWWLWHQKTEEDACEEESIVTMASASAATVAEKEVGERNIREANNRIREEGKPRSFL